MATTEVHDVDLTDEDTRESLLKAITGNTIKMFRLILPDENIETIHSIVCSTMTEVFNRIDPRKDSWSVHVRKKTDEKE